jgi:nitroimidazol reductase NimA-like FMN-containing flavoprotein (pyridoxamine 5'-phosphate oxidase superfamily)
MAWEPISERPYFADASAVTPWAQARTRLAEGDTYWLATVRADGRPHVVPVLAVWADEALHFAAGDATRKAADLTRDQRCVVTTGAPALDLVVEGRAARILDEARLRRVAEAYAAKYDWHVSIRDGAFHAEGAPTAGPPPFGVYEVIPTTVFGFPTDGTLSPTRWRFR